MLFKVLYTSGKSNIRSRNTMEKNIILCNLWYDNVNLLMARSFLFLHHYQSHYFYICFPWWHGLDRSWSESFLIGSHCSHRLVLVHVTLGWFLWLDAFLLATCKYFLTTQLTLLHYKKKLTPASVVYQTSSASPMKIL